MANVTLTAAVPVPAPPTSSPLDGRTLALVRIIWALITILVISLVITGIPVRYEKVKAAAPDIRAPEFRDLIEAGVHPDRAAAFDLAAGMLQVIALVSAGILLFWRGSDSREATFLSLALILMGPTFSGLVAVHRTIGPPFSQSVTGLLATALYFLGSSFTWSALFWLPQGRFVSRWAAWFTALLVTTLGGLYFFVSFPRAHNLVNLIGLPAILIGIGAQVYQYRRVANPFMRQQIKWAVVGVIGAALGFIVWQTLFLLLGHRVGMLPRIAMVFARLLNNASQIAVPVCFAIAILRYRLWHVDLVINRSLVYGAVTVLLGLVFVGGGFVLQSVFGDAHSTIAFAMSIAAAALLFNPTRNRAQRFVDLQLYGFRFDLNELNRAQQMPEVKNPGALTGRTLGQYRILGVLGKGGMGEVYQGERDGRMVAIKILPEELARQTDFLRRFERESQTLAAFNHPNIVKFYESGESDGVHYIVLDFVQGRELSDIIKERGRIPSDEVHRFVQDFATALDYAHKRGLIHRDIKPSNIMMRRKAEGAPLEAVLMDFGIAKIGDGRTVLTSTGAVGTISYMAPEQIMAAKTVDHRADIYALGVMVYEMLTGEVPFKGNPAQVLFAHLQQPPTDPGHLVPDLPAAAAKSVLRALEKKPEDRFQTVGEFAAALSRS